MTVGKQKVHNSLVWVINNNLQYSEVLVNEEVLNLLPENGVPSELMTLETGDDLVSDDGFSLIMVVLQTTCPRISFTITQQNLVASYLLANNGKRN